MVETLLRDYLRQTEDAITSDQIDDALARCQRILTQFPESLEAQRLLGEVYLKQGRLDEAQQAFDWVLTNDPENVIVYCDRALISERLSDYDTALDCYQQAYELSRGNSQIRQEFNLLSAKAGQQGFMFSRAGLARLYMRGDLLPQAIQEWETVLTVAPDRLDARLGLLEACWREQAFERAEQLATQILSDVPTCLKALLILAYITSMKNMQQAQELIRRAEVLDPELLKAQELFSDLMASQPSAPFFKLIHKEPVALTVDAVSAQPARTSQPLLQSNIQDISSDILSNWKDLDSWSSIDTIFQPMQNDHVPLESVTTPWISEMPNGPEEKASQFQQNGEVAHETVKERLSMEETLVNLWDAPNDKAQHDIDSVGGDNEARGMLDFIAQANAQNGTQSAQEERSLKDMPTSDWQRWYQDDRAASSSVATPEESAEIHESWDGSEERQVQDADNASANAIVGNSEAESTSAPAWLSMLTRNNERLTPSSIEGPNAASLWQTNLPESSTVSASEATDFGFSDVKDEQQYFLDDLEQDEDASSFGPAWLKSLGAATMDDEEELPAGTRELVPAPRPGTIPMQVTGDRSLASDTNPWLAQLSQEASLATSAEDKRQESDQAEYDLLSTLEGLEQDLRSQGFVPLEPNSLSTIAQSQEHGSQEPALPVLRQEERAGNEEMKETTLSSALAQLGNIPQQPSSLNESSFSSRDVFIQPVEPAATEQEASFRTTPARSLSSSTSASTPAVQTGRPTVPLTPLAPAAQQEGSALPIRSDTSPAERTTLNAPTTVTARSTSNINTGSQTETFQPAVRPLPATAPEPVRAAGPHIDMLDDLETTMKRPAIRLQSIPQKASAAQGQSVQPASRGRVGDQPTTAVLKSNEGNLSQRERLLRGYQHQLVGDYDEAMQEYRVIIRGGDASLVQEVISNVRALLKLAPKYSPGYRVLGDAYMRQGEYLQAMEAYNKALTMAKRARG